MTARNVRCIVALVGVFLVVPQHGRLLASAIQTSSQAEEAVYVTGYVARPGPYTLEDGMTVETLVQRAGGFVGQEPRTFQRLEAKSKAARAI
jgi:hypothetical protein